VPGISRREPIFVAWAIALALSSGVAAQNAVLHLAVVSGESMMHTAGSHAAKLLTVEVTDETGRPVEGARVSFQVAEEGPGGVFSNGLRTDVAVSDATGRVTVRGMQLNRTPGPFNIRVTAAKEQSRAGILVKQFIGEVRAAAAANHAAVERNPEALAATVSPAVSLQPPPAIQPAPGVKPAQPAAGRVIVATTDKKPQPVVAPRAPVAAVQAPKPASESQANETQGRSRIGTPGKKETQAVDVAQPTSKTRPPVGPLASGMASAPVRPGPVPTIVITQRQPGSKSGAISGQKSHKKWVLLGLLAAGGAAGAFAASSLAASGAHGSISAAGAASTVTIGIPTVNVGHP